MSLKSMLISIMALFFLFPVSGCTQDNAEFDKNEEDLATEVPVVEEINPFEYVGEELCTIPWGTEPGTLSNDFSTALTPQPAPGPHPWVVDANGELIVADANLGRSRRLMRFSGEGELLNWLDLNAVGLNEGGCKPRDKSGGYGMAILDSGEILFGEGYCLALLDPDFNIVLREELPVPDTFVRSIHPSEPDSFNVHIYIPPYFGEDFVAPVYYTMTFGIDGQMSEPELITPPESMYDICTRGGRGPGYVSPTGEVFWDVSTVDISGYTYNHWGAGIVKESPDGAVSGVISEYLHPTQPDFSWWLGGFFIAPSGEIYALRGTDEGANFTKFSMAKVLTVSPDSET